MQIAKGFEESTSSSSRFSWHVIALVRAATNVSIEIIREQTHIPECRQLPSVSEDPRREAREAIEHLWTFRTRSARASTRVVDTSGRFFSRPDSELKNSPQAALAETNLIKTSSSLGRGHASH